MGGLRLRKAAVGFLFRGVNEIWKLGGVLNEAHRAVVADNVPVAFLGVELHRETAHVAGEIEGALVAGDRREAHEGRGLFADFGENPRAADIRQVVGQFEIAVDAETAGVNHPLRDALMVEMKNLFTKNLVFGEHGPARPDLQVALIVGHGNALLGRHGLVAVGRGLMRRAALVERRVAGAAIGSWLWVGG